MLEPGSWPLPPPGRAPLRGCFSVRCGRRLGRCIRSFQRRDPLAKVRRFSPPAQDPGLHRGRFGLGKEVGRPSGSDGRSRCGGRGVRRGRITSEARPGWSDGLERVVHRMGNGGSRDSKHRRLGQGRQGISTLARRDRPAVASGTAFPQTFKNRLRKIATRR